MTDQSLPTTGKQSVTRLLMSLLAEREKRGIETYGKSLETFNGRDAPRDLVEELIDACQYALQWQTERKELYDEIARVSSSVIDLSLENAALKVKIMDLEQRVNEVVSTSCPWPHVPMDY